MQAKPVWVLFDFDGTLADTFPTFFDLYNKICWLLKLPKLNLYEVKTQSTIGFKDLIRTVPRWKLIILIPLFEYYLWFKAKQIKAFPGTEELLIWLKKNGYKLAVVSNNHPSFIGKVLRQENLYTLFDHIYGLKSFTNKESVLKKFLTVHKLQTDQVVFVTDEVSDWQTCTKLDIDCLGVSWGFHSQQTLVQAGVTKIFSSNQDLIYYFNKLDLKN